MRVVEVVTYPKDGEWWCPGAFRGRTEAGDTYAGCDGDPKCDVCRGESMSTVLERVVENKSWFEKAGNTWKGSYLRGWANLMASRYGRPVYLVGGALTDASPRDIDVRCILSATEFEARFGTWKNWSYEVTKFSCDEGQRRWHLEIAKMNKQGAGATQLPIDFQVQPLPEAVAYLKERRQRLDDLPGLLPPWED
jgi:hypothetical protein